MQDLLFSKTSYVLRNLLNAETEEVKLKHIESLIAHLKQHPEVRHHAVKVKNVYNYGKNARVEHVISTLTLLIKYDGQQ